MTVAIAVAGCDDDMTLDDEVTGFRAVHDNGVELNGTRFNGTRFNGTAFNGIQLIGSSFSIGNKRLSGWSLVPGTSELRAQGNDGVVYEGEELVGAILQWRIENEGGSGTSDVKLRIEGVTQSPDLPDVYFTDFSVRINGSGWVSLCTDGAGAPTEAIMVPGSFDLDTADWLPPQQGEMSIACRGAAAGKCLEWGYRVWASQGAVGLADHYRACTRMVRADYCGNNVSHTENGTAIDVSDALSPPISTPETDWAVEAKWGPYGAVCLNQPRRLEYARAAVVAECQSAGRGALPTCDDDAPGEHGGLLMSQASPS